MKYTTLSCFSSFRCLAGACPDTCCAGWEIDLDADTLERYEHLPGPLGNRIRSRLRHDGGYTFFALEQDRCPFLNGENLCELILALGEETLSVTCREHPRFVEEYGPLQETCLSISCPEAARLLLTEPVALVTTEDDAPWEEDWALDEGLLAELLDCRETLLSIVHTQRPMPERISILLAAAAEMQSALGGRNTILEGDVIETHVFRRESHRETASVLAEYFSQVDTPPLRLHLEGYLQAMQAMEFTSPRLPALLARTEAALPGYLLNSAAAERLLTYFLYRYVLRAVWDGALREKVLFCVYSTAAILALSRTLADPEPVRSAAILYSRETEHSDENLALLYGYLAEDG